MAQKTTVQLVDDIDGSEAEETVSFGLDGTQYEIDLSGEHANGLREALSAFIVAARRADGSGAGGGRRGGGQRGSGSRSSASTADRQRTAAIREWAREQGLEVNDRGRIPSRVVEAYDAAH
ncbi:MAG: Lsr2 family protein [Actinomycetota bacterium]|nr:Lsr2 family protein [Actinomycetota bacterium]